MNEDPSFGQVERLFSQALELAPEERDAFVESQTIGEPVLGSRVLSLLLCLEEHDETHEHEDSFGEPLTSTPARSANASGPSAADLITAIGQSLATDGGSHATDPQRMSLTMLATLALLGIGLIATSALYLSANRAARQAMERARHAEALTDATRNSLGHSDPESPMTETEPTGLPRRMHDQAMALADKGQIDNALALMRQAVDSQRQSIGRDHPDMIPMLQDLAGLLQLRGDNEAAAPLLDEALQIDRTSHGSNDPHVADSLQRVAELAMRRSDAAGAEDAWRECLAIREAALNSSDPAIAVARQGLNRCMAMQPRKESPGMAMPGL